MLRHPNFIATISPISNASLSGKAYFGAKINASGKVAVASSQPGRWCDGIIGEQDVPAAADLPVQFHVAGIVPAIAGGTIPAMAPVTLDAAGEFVVADDGEQAMGYALGYQATSFADGAIFPLLIDKHIAQSVDTIGLTVNAESSDTIAVDVQGPQQVSQYVAELYDSSMLEAVVGAFTMAETGAGAEVSTSARPRLIFTTDANGAAELTITDVATGSGATLFLVVKALPSAGDPPAVVGEYEVAVTFD